MAKENAFVSFRELAAGIADARPPPFGADEYAASEEAVEPDAGLSGAAGAARWGAG